MLVYYYYIIHIKAIFIHFTLVIKFNLIIVNLYKVQLDKIWQLFKFF